MSDFSDIDGGEEPLFAEYEDEDLTDPPPLPPPLAILNSTAPDSGSLDNIGAGLGVGSDEFDTQPFDTSRNDSHDQSSSAGPAAKKRKPILTFNEGRLTSPKGLQTIVNDFPQVKFKGKGHERSDLNLLINNYEEWANRLFPRLAFDDFIERAEKLGAKKEVKALVNQLRNGTTPLDDDELMLRDDEQVPIGAHQSSNTGRASEGCDDPPVGSDHHTSDPFDDDLTLGGDHHGDDDTPVNTTQQGVVDKGTGDTTANNVNDIDMDDHLSDDDNCDQVRDTADHHDECDQDTYDHDKCDQASTNADHRECDQDAYNHHDKCDQATGTIDNCDQASIDDDHDNQARTTDDKCNQARTIDNQETSLGSDKFDQHDVSCHDSITSNDNEAIHRDTPTNAQSEGTSMHLDDTPSDVDQEMLHNSVDELFHDITVDELFDDDNV